MHRTAPVQVTTLAEARALLARLSPEDLLAGRVTLHRAKLPTLDALSAATTRAPMLRDLAGAL